MNMADREYPREEKRESVSERSYYPQATPKVQSEPKKEAVKRVKKSKSEKPKEVKDEKPQKIEEKKIEAPPKDEVKDKPVATTEKPITEVKESPPRDYKKELQDILSK